MSILVDGSSVQGEDVLRHAVRLEVTVMSLRLKLKRDGQWLGTASDELVTCQIRKKGPKRVTKAHPHGPGGQTRVRIWSLLEK
jgi:hypothetical protein